VDVARDISHTERTEKELDILITRRHDERRTEEGERPAEEAWMESERRYAQRRREKNRLAWAAYHEDQAARHRATLEALIGHHEAQAAKYRENQPLSTRRSSRCSSGTTRKTR
jgi:hypothetical protein